ncbi:MAG: hypothetical protein Q9172_003096, partial [Xanthocarpia lactea]
MGCSLVDQSPLFKSTLHTCEDVLQELSHPPGWSIIDELFQTGDRSKIHEAQYSQPLCTALQIGLVTLLKSWGICFTATVGHSSGEIGAAFAAGMISLRDAIVIAYYRGLVLADPSYPIPTKDPQGSMCAVDIGQDECRSILLEFNGKVQLAAVNSPQSCTLSGDRDAIESINDWCKKRGRVCRLLNVNKAYHSRHMLPLSHPYKNYLQDAELLPTQDESDCIMFSSMTGHAVKKQDLTASYWADNMTSTVQFAAAINECIDKYPSLGCVLEVGSHPVLRSPTQEILYARRKNGVSHISTCERDTNDFESILRSAGKMIAAGVPLDAAAINAEYRESLDRKTGKLLTDLPCYQWNHTSSFWSESRVSRNVRNRRFPRHELLGSRYVDDIPSRACWRTQFLPQDIKWLNELKSDRLRGLTPAVCVLMATEAARQTLMLRHQDKRVVRLTNVEFHRGIICPRTAGELRGSEIQCITTLDPGSSRMTFEIFSTALGVTERWQLCSTGTLEITSRLVEESNRDIADFNHNPLLLQRARSVYSDYLGNVENMQMANGKIKGGTRELQYTWQDYPIHPVALASILSLGPVSLVDQNLPTVHYVSSIPMLEIQIEPTCSNDQRFTISATPMLTGGAMSKFQVMNGADGVLQGTVQHKATKLISPKPKTSSLFFKPVHLPDITRHIDIQNISIHDCVRLLTHKWPMSDVIIDNISTDFNEVIMYALGVEETGKRARFRSLFVVDDAKATSTVDSVQYVSEIDPDLQAHMIFIDHIGSIERSIHHLRPVGIMVCICRAREVVEESFSEYLEYVCELTIWGETMGALWRRKINPPPLSPGRQRIIFGNGSFRFEESLHICLQPEELSMFTIERSDGRFDAILIDDPKKSIITTWPGSDLIPFLQCLMKQAKSLLWVTLYASSSPFVDIAGTLLRTLQAEQPSLKVSWLCMNQSEMDEDFVVTKIENAFTSMVQGEGEIRLDVNQTETRIVRYLPNEDIAAATGLALPCEVDAPIEDRSYFLTLAALREPVVLSYDSSADDRTRSHSFTTGQHRALRGPDDEFEDCMFGNVEFNDDLDHDNSDNNGFGRVKVAVAASVISNSDLAAYNGQIEIQGPAVHERSKNPERAPGTFFGGKVLTSTVSDCPTTSSVIGWTRGAHTDTVVVPGRDVICVKDENLRFDVASFASLATAMAVLDGHIRAREHDNLRLLNAGIIFREAFSLACHFLNTGKSGNEQSPPITIEILETGAVVVDRTPIDVYRYLSTRPDPLITLWKTLQQQSPSFTFTGPACFAFSDYKEAFEFATDPQTLVVLIHNQLRPIPHTRIYCPSTRLFSSQGAYIIIGGLGGLGRYTCSWLVDHGATSIYAISRSGISSPEAQELYDSLNSKRGIRLDVIKADACDRASISRIFSTIRAREPIKGVINMAMLLGDAPMATMMGEEWD